MKQKLLLKLAYISTILATLTLACLGSRAVSVFSETTGIDREHCVVIDPGHGGVDGGAVSCTGVKESQLNLQICIRLNDLLQFLGYRTKMIRSEDVSVHTKGDTIAQMKMSDLRERVRICNETEGAVLLSIHQNTFTDGRYSGAQVFYGPTEESKSMAQLLQKEMIRTLNPGSKREIKKSTGVYLMENIRCPGILVECGFLSNYQEEAKLRSAEYQKELSCVIAACTARFLNG